MSEERTERIELRITPEDKAKLKSGAKAFGVTLSAFLLFSAFEKLGESVADGFLGSSEKKK